MRRVTTLKRIAIALTLFAAMVVPGSGQAAKRATLDSYCSPSGDFCTAVTRRADRIKFELSTFSFSGKYEICVRGPADRECKTSKLQNDGDLYSDRVDWLRKFDSAGPGRQKVVWKLSGTKLGETLHFRANVAKRMRAGRDNVYSHDPDKFFSFYPEH